MNTNRRVLSEDDVEAIASAVRGHLTAEEHASHHETFRVWIERENNKAARNERIRAQVGGWLVISLLSSIGYLAWKGFLLAVAVINKG